MSAKPNATTHPTVDAELRARFERDTTPLIGVLHRQAFRMTRNHADAEDLVQETLLKGFGAFRMFRQGASLTAWLHRILVNTYISGYRKTQRRPIQCSAEEITDTQWAAAAEHSATGLYSAEDEALKNWPDNDIRAAMQALPERFRTTIYYADIEGFHFREIARLTDCPIGTVMSRLHRGRRQLRDLLADVARERGYANVPGYRVAQTA